MPRIGLQVRSCQREADSEKLPAIHHLIDGDSARPGPEIQLEVAGTPVWGRRSSRNLRRRPISNENRAVASWVDIWRRSRVFAKGPSETAFSPKNRRRRRLSSPPEPLGFDPRITTLRSSRERAIQLVRALRVWVSSARRATEPSAVAISLATQKIREDSSWLLGRRRDVTRQPRNRCRRRCE